MLVHRSVDQTVLRAAASRIDCETISAIMKFLPLCLILLLVLAVTNGISIDGPGSRLPLLSGEKVLASIPVVGFGTSRMKELELETALEAALKAGYRYFDTAVRYSNERVIGKAIKRWLQEGKIKRDELFITTKLPPTAMRPGDVAPILKESLDKLQVDYVDLYLIHMPFGYKKDAYDEGHSVGDSIDYTTNHVAIWKEMEKQVQAGRVKALGMSNFNETQIQRILESATLRPVNLQVEVHLFHQQKPLVEFCKRNNITVTAYAPLGSPGLAMSGRTGEELPNLLELTEVKKIAERHNKTTAQVLLRHTLQRGIVVIPKSSKAERIQQNIDIFDFSLTDGEVATLDALDRGLDGKIFDMRFFEKSQTHPEYPWSALIH